MFERNDTNKRFHYLKAGGRHSILKLYGRINKLHKVSSWKELTLREKIGQTVICLCETDNHIERCGSINVFAEKYPIGGIYNNGGLVKGLLVDLHHENLKENQV